MTKAGIMGLAGSGYPGGNASCRGGSDPVAGSDHSLSGMIFNFIWTLATVFENTTGDITSCLLTCYLSIETLEPVRVAWPVFLYGINNQLDVHVLRSAPSDAASAVLFVLLM